MTSAKFLALSVFALIGSAVLLGLGTWQMQRMHWKEALLATLEARAAADPVTLPRAREMFTRSGDDIRFLRVAASGRYRHDAEMHLYGIWEKQPGWRIITPFDSADGVTVLIIRGFVPEALKAADTRADGQPESVLNVLGRVRFGETKGLFTPDNSPGSNQWYWRDYAEMLAGSRAGGGPEFVPFFIELDRSDHGAEWPKPASVGASRLHNRHFGYALTWFALAAALVAVYGLLFRARRKA
jgi:surfeit locus 1 family protein